MMRRRPIDVADASLPGHPRVSVLMVTYNHGPYIGQAIESVVRQRAPFPFELVIGEDCSTDRTREIVLDYQRRFPDKIRLVLQPVNVGMRENGARTFARATGDYVAFLEGDDFWTDDEKLALQVALLEANPSAFLCGARAQVWSDGAPEPSEIMPGDDSRVLTSYGARELFEGKWWFRTCTKMFPRRQLESFPVKALGRDWEGTLWLIATNNFGPICFLDRVVGVYREHAGGVHSSRARYRQVANDIRSLYKVIPYFSGNDRRHLLALLTERVQQLRESGDAPLRVRLQCTWLAAWRRRASFGWLRVVTGRQPAGSHVPTSPR